MIRSRSIVFWGVLTGIALCSNGCSEDGIDHADELGTESEGRYELVILSPKEEVPDSGSPEPVVVSSDSDPADDAVYFDPEGSFTIQIGVFKDADRARQVVVELKDQGYPAYSTASREGFRVRIGYFSQRNDAERFGRIFIADRGGEFWVDARAEE